MPAKVAATVLASCGGMSIRKHKMCGPHCPAFAKLSAISEEPNDNIRFPALFHVKLSVSTASSAGKAGQKNLAIFFAGAGPSETLPPSRGYPIAGFSPINRIFMGVLLLTLWWSESANSRTEVAGCQRTWLQRSGLISGFVGMWEIWFGFGRFEFFGRRLIGFGGLVLILSHNGVPTFRFRPH